MPIFNTLADCTVIFTKFEVCHYTLFVTQLHKYKMTNDSVMFLELCPMKHNKKDHVNSWPKLTNALQKTYFFVLAQHSIYI